MDAGLRETLDTVWLLLAAGAADRRSPVHTPVVANMGLDDAPDARVMVLRAADRAAATLRFHTDLRSPKCHRLDGQRAIVVAYHPGEAIQLRLAGTARIVTEGATIDAVWAAASPFARRAYLVEAAPGNALAAAGSGLPAGLDGRAPDAAELLAARPNFALVMVELTAIDFLHLASGGHRRARFTMAEDWRGCWVVP